MMSDPDGFPRTAQGGRRHPGAVGAREQAGGLGHSPIGARQQAGGLGHSPIEDYALIGDLHTGALISRAGAIDWLCMPRFDSPTMFGALLDSPEAGQWSLAPTDDVLSVERAYLPGTFVLRTVWRTT